MSAQQPVKAVMSVVVSLPIRYAVQGVLKGRRKPLDVTVTEAVQVAVPEIGAADIEVRTRICALECFIASRRPWLPVFDGTSRNVLATPAALSNWSQVQAAFSRPLEFGLVPVSLPPIRFVPRTDDDRAQVSVPPGTDFADLFRTIEWTDRDEALAAVRLDARIAVVEGVPMTDRFEPVLMPGRDPADEPTTLVDVVSNDRLTTHGGLGWVRHEKERWLAVPRTDGPFAGLVDWETDVSVGCAAYLADRLHDVMFADAAATGNREFVAAAGPDAAAAFSRCKATSDSLADGLRVSVRRGDMEDMLDALEAASRIDRPMFRGKAERIARVIANARGSLAAFDAANSVVAGIDDDAIDALASGMTR